MASIEQTYPLGSRGASGEQEHLLGSVGCFRHTDPDSTEQVDVTVSNLDVVAIWVKNEAGVALEKGSVVIWDTGATYGPGKATGVEVTSGTTVAAGVVDPHISGDVADNDHYWLIVKGPCQFKFTTGTTIGVGDVLAAGASGRVTDLDHTGLSDQLLFDRCGRCMEAVDTAIASDTLFDGYADFRF